jgi:cytoskeletal protein CcmA (bactofilin family)
MLRRSTTALATALLAVLLPVITATAATASTPVGTVTGVTSAVNERTPLYHLELEFSLTGVQCPAVVDYEMGNDTLSAPVDQCVSDPDGTFATATATTMRPMFGPGLGVIKPSGFECDGAAVDRGPGCQVDVFVRHADDPVQLIDDRTLEDANGNAIEVWIPPRPVWVGVGDGYTSRVSQAADWCFEKSARAEAAGQQALGGATVFAKDADDHPGDPTAVVCDAEAQQIDPETGHELWYHPDPPWDIYHRDPESGQLWRFQEEPPGLVDPGDVTVDDLEPDMATESFLTAQDDRVQSWINSVVQTFNLEFDINGTGIPCDDSTECWEVEPEVIAANGTHAAQLKADAGDPTGQLDELHDILTGPDHLGSWNWIGMSAGLLDAGIPQAIRDRYPTDADGYVYEPLDGTGYVPWRPAGGDPCPALPTISSATAADVTAGIQNVIAQASTWSPGLKSVVVRYPYLTEVKSTATGANNACAPANRGPIDALNDAIDAAIESFPAGDDVFQLNLAADLDLEAGFTDEPTDSVPGRQSYLQLTRPFGYPYPSDYGASAMGTQAYQTIEESGLQPPKLASDVVQADDPDPDSPSTSAASLNYGGWFRDENLFVEWQPDAPEGEAELTPRSPLERGANRLYTGLVKDRKGQTAGAQATVSYDPDPPRVTSTLSGGVFQTVNGTTWYRVRPTITWQVIDDSNAHLYTPVNPPSGPKVIPAPISVYPDGKSVVIASGRAEDAAGNFNSTSRTLNVDTVAPTVTGTASTGTGWSKAATSTVTWSRYDATSGLAGLVSHPDGYVGTHPFPGGTVSAEGRTTVSHTVFDMAGNSGTASIDVLLDRTAPTMSIPQVPAPVNGQPAQVPADQVNARIAAINSRGCDLVDAAPSPGIERSPITFKSTPVLDTSEVTGGLLYEFTCTGRDAAGNEGVAKASFFVEITDPPTLEGKYVNPANGSGWWKTDVRIDWTATPAPGWSLLPYLGDVYGTNWNIAGDGIGTHRTTHTAEGVYPAPSPQACHSPAATGSCAGPITMPLKIDKTPPRVDPSYTSPPASGWFRTPPTVSWLVADAVPLGLDATQVSGVEPATLPAPVTAGEGITNLTASAVTDRAGNSASGSVTVKVDSTKPTIDAITGVTADKLYNRNNLPGPDAVTCTATDRPPASAPQAQPSGVDANGCKVARLLGPLPESGPPIREVTWQATATDVAGNVQRSTVVARFLDAPAGQGLYAIFSEAPDHLVVGSGIKVRGYDGLNNAYVYSGHTGNGTSTGTRAVIEGAADIQGDYHAQGGVLLDGSAQIRKDLLAKGNVVLRGNTTVHGDVITTGSITLEGSAKILGNAVSGGSINITGGGSYIQGNAQAAGAITHPSWANNFVRGTKSPNSTATVSGPTAYPLPSPPSSFDIDGWPKPYRTFATCAAFNASLNEYFPVQPSQGNRNDFRGTYFIAESGCTVAPGGDSHALTLTGNAAIVASGCIETKGSASFRRPAGSNAELWLVSLHAPANDAACTGAQQVTKGVRLAGGSWLSSVPTLVYARNESRISGSTTIWGQVWGKRVVVDGGYQQDFKPFLLPCFTGLLSTGATNCPGDNYGWPADGTGTFVIGNRVNASVGQNIYFWGSQWRQNNPVTGTTHNSFKGYEMVSTTPTCGATWTTRPGNSSPPPDTVPRYMAVVVSSYVKKSGSTLSGDVQKVVIVDTAGGYDDNPGHIGTGKVVRVLCG